MTRRGRRVWFATWALTSLFAGVLWLGIAGLNKRHSDERDRLVTDSFVRTADALIEEDLQRAITTAWVVVRDAELVHLAKHERAPPRPLQERWRILAEEDVSIQQVRLIGHAGRERIRVDRRADEVVVVDAVALQDKSDRPYFIAGASSEANRLLLTEVELNRESGLIEVPWRSTFRVVSALRDDDAKLVGVVVINFDAAHLLARVNRSVPPGVSAILYNSSGHVLAGGPPEERFSFEFGRQPSLPTRAPTLWRWVESTDYGQLELNDAVYAVQTAQLGSKFAVPGQQVQLAGRLKLVGTHTHASLIGATAAMVASLLMLLLGVATWSWSGKVTAHRAAVSAEAAATRQALKNEKMAALGSIVAGVAHELNTPLGNAISVTSTLRDYTREFDTTFSEGRAKKSEVRLFLDELHEGGEMQRENLLRAVNLVDQFKRVAVDHSGDQRRPFDLREVIEDIVRMVRPRFKATRIAIEVRLEDDRTLDSYPGPFGQVLMILIDNARVHAFDDGKAAGTIVVTARGLPEDRVEVLVEDDGVGIPERCIPRVFEPFYTTRLGQGGSGLGLAIGHNQVRMALGGELAVQRRPHGGTQFSIVLPLRAPQRSIVQNPHHVESPDEVPRAA